MRLMTIAIVLAVLAGCGTQQPAHHDAAPTSAGQPANASSPGTRDACRLLTKDEVGQVLGGQAEDGRPSGGGLPGQRACGFGIVGTTKLVSITIFPGDKAVYEQHRAQIKEPDPKSEDISGLGEAAFRSAGYLYVHKGQQILTLFISGFGSDGDVRAKLLQLAPKAIGRM